MSKREQKYVVSYDITSDRLRRKVASELKNYGRRVQYSVFECTLTEARYSKMYGKLLKLCSDSESDSIRIYTLCENCTKKITSVGLPKENLEIEKVIII